jgi:DNA protecting protein DprA
MNYPDQPIQLGFDIGTPAERSTHLPFPVAFMALAFLPGLGFKGLRALIDALGEDLGRVWDENVEVVEGILSRARVPGARSLAHRIHREAERWIERGHLEVRRLEEEGIRLLSPADLPPSLKGIPDAPRWLFVQGNSEILNQKPTVAVVGTRKPTKEGRRAAQIVAEILAAYPIVVISGLAEGIDAEVHAATLREGVLNIAFLGHGIRLIFPHSTSSLRMQIVEQGGAVVTEYLPDERYDRRKFVARNRLQAALADLVIPVEGGVEGGTAHTIRFAQRYGRQILGLRWEGSDGLVGELARMGVELVDPFTSEGRKRLDERLRILAEEAGHPTCALRRVEQLLERECESRTFRLEDIEHLKHKIMSLYTHIGTKGIKK